MGIKLLSDIAEVKDIKLQNAAGAETGRIQSVGNDLVFSNAVGDVLIGDGASDVYIGDGTNSVDILFEVSGSLSAESGAELTLGGAGGTLALGGAISLADAVSAMSGTGVNTIDIGTNAKPFKNIYAAHHVGGSSINYATSRGWVEDAAPLSSTQVGYFGGNFIRNGDAAENEVVWGLDPFGNKALLWKAIMDTSDDDDDGGWNKEIVVPANNNIGYLSYVYFKLDFTPDSGTQGSKDGTVYLGAGQIAGETITLAGANNTNPYFVSSSLFSTNNGGPVVADRWYLIVGILQAYNNSTTDTDTITGVYDVETGEKVIGGTEYKMGNNTTGQKHRAYIYYDQSTDDENAYFWNPGFHAIDGSEPKIQDLVKRQVYLDDNVKAAFGNSDDLQIYHDGSDSIIKDAGTGSLDIYSSHVHLKSTGGTNNLAQFFSGGHSYIYANNVLRVEATTSGVEITGNADISGTLDVGAVNADGDITVTKSSATVKVEESGGADMRMAAGGSTGYIGTWSNDQVYIMQNSASAITIDTSRNATFAGAVIIPNLPTSDPGVVGQLWNDSGTLKISAG